MIINKHIKLYEVLFTVLFILVSFALKSQESAKYVWINDTGEGIQSYIYFRNEIQLSSSDANAAIHLYAFSRYALYVNGSYINFGPIRSYPQHPYFDSYDISPYLKKGKNVIAVKVMNNFIETFQLPSYTGGFIAWGEVKENKKVIASFATPGNWICRKASGYMTETPRFSFAKAGVEVYDAREEPDDWKAENVNHENWKNPVLLKNQRAFGTLKPRTILPLTQDTYVAKYTLNQLTIKDEPIYNYHKVEFDTLHQRNAKIPKAFYLYTWIYSPQEQPVKGSLSWGDFYLNGERIKQGKQLSPFREEFDLKLNEGWNYFAGQVNAVFNSADFIFSPDENATLYLSVDKDRSKSENFRVTKLIPSNTKQAEVLNFFKSPSNAHKLTSKWSVVNKRNTVLNPPKIVSWKKIETIDSIPSHQVTNLRVNGKKEQAFLFDMGRMMLGRIFIDVDAPAGTVFDITFSEDIRDGLLTLYKRNQINAGLRFISDGKTQRFESFKPYGVRFLQVNISGQTSDVTLKNIGVVSQTYPFEKTGSFECSDPLFNAIWEMGWRTLQVCAEDSYTDTPFRERGHYAGDLFPQYAITAVSSGDTRLLKHTIRVIADQYEKVYRHEETTVLSDYPLINFMIASWYIRQYNDLDFAREIYPQFSYYMDKYWELRNKGGLFHPYRTFFEWVQIDRFAALTGFQAMMKAGYDDLSGLSGLLGKTSDKSRYQECSTILAQTINKKLWNAEKGIYFDGYNDEGYLSTAFPNSSVFPIIWNIADNEKVKSAIPFIADALLNPGPPVNRRQLSSPYGSFYGLAALYKHQKANIAEQIIRKHWGKMIYEGDDTTWEDFNRDNHSTLSHAWSGSPTYYLSTQVLGVDLGFPSKLSTDTIFITPQAESITWAKGKVPHPKGLVSVEWKIENECLFLNYKTPENVPVVIKPKGKLSNLILKVNEKDF